MLFLNSEFSDYYVLRIFSYILSMTNMKICSLAFLKKLWKSDESAESLYHEKKLERKESREVVALVIEPQRQTQNKETNKENLCRRRMWKQKGRKADAQSTWATRWAGMMPYVNFY